MQAEDKVATSANPNEQKLISTLSEGNKTVEPFDYNVYGDKIKNGEGQYASYKISDGNKSYILQIQGYTAGAYGKLIQARIAEPDFWRNGAIATNTLTSLDEVAKWANEVVNYEKSKPSFFPADSLGAKITNDMPQGTGAKSLEFPYKERVNQQNSTQTAFTQKEQAIDGLHPEDSTHQVITDKNALEKAQERIDFDFEGEKADLPHGS